MTTFKIKVKNFLILFTLAAFGAAGVSGLFQNKVSAAGFSGKIYTSTFNGQFVPANKYSSKDAVYLNGGPVHEGAQGLPDGTYYFQVTGPSGNDLLSTDPAICRQLIVANGVIAAADGPACQHPTGIPQSDGSRPVKLMPFNDTPNPGGNYKAWLIQKTNNTTVASDGIHINFKNSDAKSEIFRVEDVPCTNCSPTATLSGHKFYDANQNAFFDPDEVPVQGVQISVEYTFNGDTTTNIVTTDGLGDWSVVVPTGAQYLIGELVPNTGTLDSIWLQTAPLADIESFQGYIGTANGNQTGLNFGNVCISVSGPAPAPCPVSYDPPPTPTPTPEPTATPTPCPECNTITLSGKKFYDANANGLFDGGEVSLEGVQIVIILTDSNGTTFTVVTTDASGDWSLLVPPGAQYLIGEFLPDTGSSDQPGSYWEQTAPAANDEGFRGYVGTANENQTGLNFGDVCYRPDGTASSTPCGVSYPSFETPTPEPTPTGTPPDNQ